MKTIKIEELLNDYNKGKEYPYEFDSFVNDCKRYISATKQNRLICTINHVSQSGMTRHMKFVEMGKGRDNQHYIWNFYQMLDVFGFRFKDDSMVISGCGMDMVFSTHYNIIRDIKRLGIITLNTCIVLEQKQPSTI